MMTGLLRSKGICVSEGKVGQSLKRLDPVSHQTRQETAGRSLNPKCYKADYFGHKVHLDQNEKLRMFGVTHVMARDGYSGMIIAYSTMPIKNNLIIYDEIYRHFTATYGLWDQIRVDGGQEFNLVCHIQEYLRNKRRNPTIEPFKSTKSTENNIIERMWVEVNSRVNYPIKSALGQFARDGFIDMSLDYTKFAVSWVTCHVSKVGLKRFVEAWNHHSVPKKGRPIDLMTKNNKAMPVSQSQLMNKKEAAEHYEQITTRKLTLLSTFGIDPLQEYSGLQARREEEFLKKCNFENIFSKIQQGDATTFRFSIQFFLRLTFALLHTME